MKSLAFPKKVGYINQCHPFGQQAYFLLFGNKLLWGDVMGRRIMRRNILSENFSDGLFPLVLLAVSFTAGSVGGFFLTLFSDGSQELTAYLQQYFQAVCGADTLSVSLWSVAWDMVRWPLLVLLGGMTRLCIFAVPVIVLIRAFLLSHAIAVFVQMFGGSGFLVALVLFGVTAIFVIPVLIILAYDSIKMAALHDSRTNVFLLSRDRLIIFLTCAGCVVLATVVQWCVIPPLLTGVCANLFI